MELNLDHESEDSEHDQPGSKVEPDDSDTVTLKVGKFN